MFGKFVTPLALAAAVTLGGVLPSAASARTSIEFSFGTIAPYGYGGYYAPRYAYDAPGYFYSEPSFYYAPRYSYEVPGYYEDPRAAWLERRRWEERERWAEARRRHWDHERWEHRWRHHDDDDDD